MFQFIFALFLINSYSVIRGAPTQNATMLSDTLNDLASNCENQFLSTQIRNKINDCHVPVPPYHEKQFECLFFYDINRQLCEAVATSKLVLNEDYSAKILEEQDVSQLCNTAKDWTFTDINEVYKKTVKLVFHSPVRCSKICSVESDDILNVDSTFFCKYFKWGSEILKPEVSIVSTAAESASVVSAQASSGSMVGVSKVEESVTPNKILDQKIETYSAGSPPSQKPDVKDIHSLDKVISEKVEISNSSAHYEVKAKASNVITSEKPMEHVVVSENIKKDEIQPVLIPANTATSSKEQPNQPTQKILKNETASNANKNGVDNNNKVTVSEVQKVDTGNNLLNQLENPKPKEIGESDYQVNDVDSDEGRDGLLDTQGDDIDDPSLADLETKLDLDLNKKPVKSHETIYNNDISPKESYSNTIPDGFSEDDDHFFPFFLTAIIMVILIYILYHNKSKVSKVFLGLIVEGRQTGRRRNSRGHAYRRLDTLEQAMNANTAAPPSKIIY